MEINDIKQTKWMTATEALLNVGSGMFIAFSISQLAVMYQATIQYYLWEGFQWQVSLGSNIVMTAVFTAVSVIRGYLWRRVFNHHHAKEVHNKLTQKTHS